MKSIVCIVVVLIAGLILYQVARFLTLKNVGEKIAAHTKPFEIHPANVTKYILVLGDSLAVGVGASTPEKSIAGLISKEEPSADITNLSVSGSKIIDALHMIQSVGDKHFDLVVIQIGGNDVVQLTSVSDATRDLAELLKISKTKGDKVVFFSSGSVGFSPIFPQPLDSFYTQRTVKLYSKLKAVAGQEKVTYVDLYLKREDDPFKNDINLYYADDYFHVSDAGYAFWYAKIKPSL